MKTHSADHIAKVLGQISARIPTNLRNAVSREQKATPTMEFVVDEALKGDTLSEEKKAQLRTLKENGEFSKMQIVEDHKIAKMIDEFVSREINKEIKKGNLPTKGRIKDLSHVKEIYAKVHNSQN